MASATKRKFTSRFDEGYDLEDDEFYTVWAKLKQLSLCDESEAKNDGDEKHEDDLKDASKSKEQQACHSSNPMGLGTRLGLIMASMLYEPDMGSFTVL